MVEMVEGLG